MPLRLVTAVVLTLAAVFAPEAFAEALSAPVETWVPDGEVHAVAISGPIAYLGGNFTRLAPYTGSSAVFNAANAELTQPWPQVDGVVEAVAADGSGGWYLGGEFKSVGGVPRTDLAHIRPDRTLDPNWAPSTNGHVQALAVGSGFVVAGGDFSMANGTARGRLAAFNTTTGALTAFNGSVTGGGQFDAMGVYDLLIDGSTLYAVGEFTSARDGTNAPVTRNRGASFNIGSGTTSQVTTWDPNADRVIDTVAQSGTDLFIGGRFTQVNGSNPTQARSGLAKVSEATGALNGWTAPGPCCSTANDLTVVGTRVYAVGTFQTDPGNPDPSQRQWHAVAYDTASAALITAFHPPVSGFPHAIAATASTVYVGNVSSTTPTLRAFSASNGAATGFAPQLGRGSQELPSGGRSGVLAVGIAGADVIAGGTFENVGGVARDDIGAIDMRTGRATDFAPQMDGMAAPVATVQALTVSGGLVWAGGPFLTPGGANARNGLAAFDATTGALADFKQNPNGQVSALASSGSTVYAAGDFTMIGTTPRRNVAAVENVPGSPGTVLPFDGDADGPVRALALSGNELFLGGQFTSLNGSLASHRADRRNLGAVDRITGDALPWDPDADGEVDALALDSGTMFVGGTFATVNRTVPRTRLAAVDPGSGAAFPWAPSADATVRALAVNGPTVFAGGDFAGVNGGTASHAIAALDRQTGVEDPVGLDVSADERNPPILASRRVDALAASPGSSLLVGGSLLRNAPAPPAANFLAFGLPPLPPPPAPGGETPGGPSGGGGGGTAGPGDVVAPDMSALSASARRFRVGPGTTQADGTATAAAAKKKKAPRGTTLTLRLSEPARVKFEVFAKGKGRKVGKRCVKQTKRNRKRKRCTLLTLKKPAFTRSAPAGRSKVKWSGRLGRKALKRGSYQLRATPTDAAGNTGKPRTLNFTIVR